MSTQRLLDQVDGLIEELGYYHPMDSIKEEEVVAKIKLEWTYHSNAIEGNSLTFGETRALALHDTTAKAKPLKDHLDIKGHYRALNELDEFLKRKDKLTETWLRGMHQLLLVEPYEETGFSEQGVKTSRFIRLGQYKSKPNHVRTSTGEVHYFSAPEDVPFQMAQLIEQYVVHKAERKLHTIELAAIIHHKFVSIHPFDDGNGRMARILMNLVLIEGGYVPAIIRLEEKGLYLSALERANVGEFSDLIEIIAVAVKDTVSIYLKAARGETISDLMDTDKEITLLLQSLDTQYASDSPIRTREFQTTVLNQLTLPVLAEIHQRVLQLDKLFTSRTLHVVLKHGAAAAIVPNGVWGDMRERIIEKSNEEKLVELTYFYHPTGYVYNAIKDFLINIRFVFTERDYTVLLQVTGIREDTLFSASYDERLDEEAAIGVAKNAMGKILEGFRKVVKD